MNDHDEQHGGDDRRGSIYVGYLPLPRRHRTFVRVLVPAMLWFFALAAGVISVTQRDPGAAEWDTSMVRTWTGDLIDISGYPFLLADGTGELLPIVEQGKLGGRETLLTMAGSRVELSGWLLARDGRMMIELEPGEAAVAPAEGEPRELGWADLGQRTLEGEIADFKCYLGAMKPGSGKGHKSCAVLCLEGGIPPVLVTRGPNGSRGYYVLVGPAGERLAPDQIALAAEPVRVTGTVRTLLGARGLPVIRVPMDGIEVRGD